MVIKRLFKWTESAFSDELVKIHERYRDEFILEQLETNISRESIYALILIVWNLLMVIYMLYELMAGKWGANHAYKYLFGSHITAVAFQPIFLGLRQYCKQFSDEKRRALLKVTNLSFVYFVLLWTAASSIISQMIYSQITAYDIGILIISASILLNPLHSLIAYLTSYIALAAGLLVIGNDTELIYGFIINAAILVVLCYVISRSIYAVNVKEFIYRKAIYEKTQQLENAQDILEEAVRKRTEELNSANKKLIQEMEARHVMEIQILKTETMMREKDRQLNEAREYDQLRSEFFANISHEFRTPLNIIFCTIQMLELLLDPKNEGGCKKDSCKDEGSKGEDSKEEIRKYLRSMRQNCYRLIRLVGNLIDITKIDSGYMKASLSNNDIVSITEDITKSVAHYVQSCGIRLVFDTEVEEKVIACDPDKIERIMLNLLSNAVKYTRPGGTILVRVYIKENNVFLAVRDTGIGIPRDKQSAVFERFVQVDKSLTRSREGSGIGLSLVKSLVEMHSGKIHLTSEPGKGSEFIVELPDYMIPGEKNDSINNNVRKDFSTDIIKIEFSDIYYNC